LYISTFVSHKDRAGFKPVENDILNAEKTVNKEKMASYAEILKDDGKENENTNTNINTKSNSSSV
jgi:hypothetical protein